MTSGLFQTNTSPLAAHRMHTSSCDPLICQLSGLVKATGDIGPASVRVFTAMLHIAMTGRGGGEGGGLNIVSLHAMVSLRTTPAFS